MSNFEMIFECHIICQTAEMATPSHNHSPFWKHLDLEALEQIGKSKMRKAVPDSRFQIPQQEKESNKHLEQCHCQLHLLTLLKTVTQSMQEMVILIDYQKLTSVDSSNS